MRLPAPGDLNLFDEKTLSITTHFFTFGTRKKTLLYIYPIHPASQAMFVDMRVYSRDAPLIVLVCASQPQRHCSALCVPERFHRNAHKHYRRHRSTGTIELTVDINTTAALCRLGVVEHSTINNTIILQQ